MQFCAVQCTLRTVFLIFLFFKPESSNLVCRIEIRCLIHSYRLFFDKQSVHRYSAHGHSIVHTVFLPFCFFKLESSNLVCRIEFRFRKHSYRLFFDKQGAHSAHCALFSQFLLFFKLESSNLVCRIKIRDCNHSYTEIGGAQWTCTQYSVH